jgi:hypothetical protein
MPTFNKFQDFSEQLASAVHNFKSHTFKMFITNTSPVATNTVLEDITEIAYTNISGAAAPTVTVALSRSEGTTTVAADEEVVTATGAVPTFQYYGIYNDSAASKNLVAWWDHGSTVTLAAGETFTARFDNDATAGTILTLA